MEESRNLALPVRLQDLSTSPEQRFFECLEI